jgi:prolyl-tRNA synthetase
MRRSKSFIKTLKETPADADSINASLLTRAGFVQKHMAGVYALLPLGLRVYKKIENIVREELDSTGANELLMNVLQPRELWEETNRWKEIEGVMYKAGPDIGLAPTHEEQVTDIVRGKISSYKDLPLSLYQFQVKFRNEPRAKSGLLRGREFLMKDMYSFHATEDDFEKYYQQIIVSYKIIFSRIGLETKLVAASGGMFSKYSHEFQVICPTGEDTVYACEKCDFAENIEIAKVKNGDKCPKCNGRIREEKSIEVANIFPLKDKFSSTMKARVLDAEGKENNIIMGCYGIGMTRAMATIVEMFNDPRGIIWPESISPYKVNLISLDKNEQADKIYKDLSDTNIEVLYDDRAGVSAGEKFADADLIGCPYRVIISEKSLTAGGAEISKRQDPKKFEIVSIDKILDKVK